VKDETATSESIGTIALVALTVILAAIILVFALNSAEKVDDGHILGFSAYAEKDLYENRFIHFTYHGGQSHDQLVHLNWTLSNLTAFSPEYNVTRPEVGYTWESNEFTSSQWYPPYRILIVATFDDDVKQVVFEKFFLE
jgi:hypothetical protein